MTSSDSHVRRGQTWQSALVVLLAVLLSLGVTGESLAGGDRLGSSEAPAESAAAVTVPPGPVDAHPVIRADSGPSGVFDRGPGRGWLPPAIVEMWQPDRLSCWQVRAKPAIPAGTSGVVRTCRERAPPWANSVS